MTSNLVVHEKEEPLQAVWQIAREHLEKKKSQISEEILHYPPPIPACDAQFNFLLAERARLSQALGQLATLGQAHLSDQDQLEGLQAFILSSPDLDETAVYEIQSILQAVPKRV